MTFPLNCWRYHARIEIDGSDRRNLPDCLESETLSLWEFTEKDDAYTQIRDGQWLIEGAFSSPYQAFAQDLAVVSVYLFQIVRGVEIVERYVSETQSDDVRAWKVVARQGEWVKVPLLVREDAGAQKFHVDLDADDLDVIRSRWTDYPLWFHDGMRRKYPVLRDL